jgi:hypothetical protein
MEHETTLPQEGIVYKMSFPMGEGTTARLVKLRTYPATGMPTDYIFQCFDEHPLKHSSAFVDAFNLPEGILYHIVFEEITDPEILDGLDLSPFEVKYKPKAQHWYENGGPRPKTFRDDPELLTTRQGQLDRLEEIEEEKKRLRAEIARLEALQTVG